MKVVVLQPSYLPWLGYFDQLFQSDIFVLYDDVQYDKQGWRNRNRIKTSSGPQWLTVPVLTGGQGPQLIKDIRIDSRQNWARKHLAAIRQSYAKAPYFGLYWEELANLLGHRWHGVADLTIAGIHLLAGWLMLDRLILCSSQLGIEGGRNERLVSICKSLHADVYLSGRKAMDYLDVQMFHSVGIDVAFQNYEHPVYRQFHGPFVPYLSVLDLLFNHGPDSLAILTRGASLARMRRRVPA